MRNVVLGFVAGFIAVLLFHQPALSLLSHLGLVKAGTYNFSPVGPLHVPQVISLAFWGGVWGVLFAFVQARFPRGARYWLFALLFGALLPTLVAWFVVAPMKGQPLAAGWQANRMLTGLIINGAWGLGTAILFTLGNRFAK
jgi:hypothetical protein